MANGTESFNEANVQADFREIMANADIVRKVLAAGDQEINECIGNDSEADAWGGGAALSVKNQWSDLASTFEVFLSNFQHWYDQQSDAAKALQNFEANNKSVNLDV